MAIHDKKESAATIQAKFRQGVALHRQAKFSEAELIYRAILQLEPASFEALHLLGIVALQTHRPEQSAALIGKAIARNPNVAAAHGNLGSALYALKRFDEALSSLDKATALAPDFAEAHCNRAAVLSALTRHEQALASCEKAIALKEDYPEAHNNRALALNGLKRHAQALASCDKAIALKPNYPEAYNNRGIALNAMMRYEEAVASYDRAIAINPKYAEAYNNRGNALYNMGRLQEALASYDKAIACASNYAAAHNNRGNALRLLARHQEALASYDTAIALRPDYIDAHFNKSLLLLVMGRFEEGWRLYEVRKKKLTSAVPRHVRWPQWSGGQAIAGKTLLLHDEQGMGDTIQFCRYVPLVADLGARVILEVPKALTKLLAGLSGVAQIVESGAATPPADYQCSLMSLPWAFKTTLSTIPASVPYLVGDAEKARAWKEKLGEKIKPRVGLVWSGGLRADQPETWSVNKRRNIPLAKFAPLNNPRLEFYSLQKGQPAEQELAELNRGHWPGPEIIDFTADLRDFSDTAALIENLDLVITVDTSIAHLTGALGKPVWILNRFDNCWRWLVERTDSPWYPTARLYRQEQGEDWDGVVRRVGADLVDFTARHAQPDPRSNAAAKAL